LSERCTLACSTERMTAILLAVLSASAPSFVACDFGYRVTTVAALTHGRPGLPLGAFRVRSAFVRSLRASLRSVRYDPADGASQFAVRTGLPCPIRRAAILPTGALVMRRHPCRRRSTLLTGAMAASCRRLRKPTSCRRWSRRSGALKAARLSSVAASSRKLRGSCQSPQLLQRSAGIYGIAPTDAIAEASYNVCLHSDASAL